MDQRRSVGITFFAIIYTLFGAVSFLNLSAFSILYLILGIGLFMRKASIRILAVVVSILGIVVNVVKAVSLLQKQAGKPINSQILVALIGTFLIHASIIYFFTRPSVKAQFQKQT